MRAMPNHFCNALLASAVAIASARAHGASWPMFRGEPALRGVALGSLPSKLQLAWSFKTGGPVKSSPAIEQDKVFVGSNDESVYGLSFAAGKRLWAFKTGGAVESSPLALDGKVFVGSSDGVLYALDAATGSVAWKYKTEDKILASPNWIKEGG